MGSSGAAGPGSARGVVQVEAGTAATLQAARTVGVGAAQRRARRTAQRGKARPRWPPLSKPNTCSIAAIPPRS